MIPNRDLTSFFFSAHEFVWFSLFALFISIRDSDTFTFWYAWFLRSWCSNIYLILESIFILFSRFLPMLLLLLLMISVFIRLLKWCSLSYFYLFLMLCLICGKMTNYLLTLFVCIIFTILSSLIVFSSIFYALICDFGR